MAISSSKFAAVLKGGGRLDLSARAKWRILGADRQRYLNGQVTNDVRKAKADETLYACVTNAKGRMEGDVYVRTSSEPDGPLWLDAEAELREGLGMRLEKYVVADDVEIQEVTDEWRLWHFFGAASSRVVRASLPEGAVAVRSLRLREEGVDVWLPSSAPGLDLTEGAEVLTDEEFEQLRIVEGVPRWPRELNGNVFPQEAGLESRVMDFFKGCYIGQEILSRIKSTGKMPHRLAAFTTVGPWEGGASLQDALVYAPGPDANKEVGRVTSACPHPELDRWVGLAYVRQGVEATHSRLLAGHAPNSIFTELEINP